MSDGDQRNAADDRCGKWMPRKRAHCARRLDHKGECRTAEALADSRQRITDRRRGVRRRDDPEARRRWHRKHKFVRLGITETQFNELLEGQDYRCAICRMPFRGKRVCVDHDHTCCPKQIKQTAKTCGKCIRGLLCVPCNTGLGFLEDWPEQISTYLASPPAAFLRVNQTVGRSGIEPLTPAV